MTAEKPASYCWLEFLKSRKKVIHWMREEFDYTDSEIAKQLSMDTEHVYLTRTGCEHLK